jgi:putative glutathione S-transferase
MLTRAIKGLEDVISVTIAMPGMQYCMTNLLSARFISLLSIIRTSNSVWQRTKPDDPDDTHSGWTFADPDGKPFANSIGLGGPFPPSYPENKPDPHMHAKNIREIYENVNDVDGKYTVPILFDKKRNTIVSNESSEIIQMLNWNFNELAAHAEVNLAPEELKEAMNEVDSWIYPDINNGVYRCGFAKSQQAYNKAIEDLTVAFDRIEELLSKQRFIAGDTFTLSDIRLFVTLLRFDEVYVVYFKTNTRSVINSPNMLNYCREIYQMPGVAATVDMSQIKEHYYCSHPDLNRFSIIPKGPDFEKLLKERHNRDSLAKHT